MSKREPLIIDVTPDKVEVVTLPVKTQRKPKKLKAIKKHPMEKIMDDLVEDCVQEAANVFFNMLFKRRR